MPPVKELHGLDFHKPDPAAAPDYQAAAKDLTAFNRARKARELRQFTPTDLKFMQQYLALRPQSSLDEYAKLFIAKGNLLSGDITPAYSAIQPPRIAEIATRFPDTKVIFFARDPVDRFWSQFCMDLRLKRQEFTADVGQVEKLLRKNWAKRRSFPTRIVKNWRVHYGRRQFRVFFFDDLQGDPAGLRRAVLSFLGADPAKPSGSLPVDLNRKSGQTRPMPFEIERYLSSYFAKELVQCASELGGPARAWAGKHGL